MRQLHPVSFHERFVASGTYVYAQDGVDTGDVEHWTLHEPGDGGLTLRTDYDGRIGSGLNWLFEGFARTDTRRVERFDLTLFGTQRTDAKFVFDADAVQISLRIDGVAQDRLDIPLPPTYAVRPPALIASALFADVTVTGLPVFVPLMDFASGLVEGGAVETFAVEALGPDIITVDDRQLDAHTFRLRGERDIEFTCWLDSYAILLCYEAASGLTARLTQYVHRPETTS